jgi:transposase
MALSKKNSFFTGSGEGGENWACLASLSEACKLNGVNPQTYFTDLLTRLVDEPRQPATVALVPKQPS